MTIEEAIKQRHSVRKYIHKPLSTEVVRALEEKIMDILGMEVKYEIRQTI